VTIYTVDPEEPHNLDVVTSTLATRPDNRSIAEQIAELPAAEAEAWLDSLPEQLLLEVARREWWYVARPDQMEPAGDDWAIWLILAGRGWGKTRSGGEWLIDKVIENPVDVDGHPTEWAAVAETLQDGRTVLCEGPSGLRNVLHRRGVRHRYVRWPNPVITLHTGQVIHILGADDEDVGRGLNLAGAWLDEIAKWKKPTGAWLEGIGPALRTKTPRNSKPRVVVTTTPKPIPLLFDWTKRTDGSVVVTRGSTFDNAANLSEAAIAEFVRLYGNSRIGRQELYAELLEDVERRRPRCGVGGRAARGGAADRVEIGAALALRAVLRRPRLGGRFRDAGPAAQRRRGRVRAHRGRGRHLHGRRRRLRAQASQPRTGRVRVPRGVPPLHPRGGGLPLPRRVADALRLSRIPLLRGPFPVINSLAAPPRCGGERVDRRSDACAAV
jgi:hypothetical protein